jgi:hypothetical protein
MVERLNTMGSGEGLALGECGRSGSERTLLAEILALRTILNRETLG